MAFRCLCQVNPVAGAHLMAKELNQNPLIIGLAAKDSRRMTLAKPDIEISGFGSPL